MMSGGTHASRVPVLILSVRPEGVHDGRARHVAHLRKAREVLPLELAKNGDRFVHRRRMRERCQGFAAGRARDELLIVRGVVQRARHIARLRIVAGHQKIFGERGHVVRDLGGADLFALELQ